MRTLLLEQLEIPWALASRYILPNLTPAHLFWEPSRNVVSVKKTPEGWRSQLPESETPPVPDTTIAWLLWHIEWWWGDAVAGVEGRTARAPADVAWSGTLSDSLAELNRLHAAWVEILSQRDLAMRCAGPWPTPQPLSTIAGWVNVELMKNVAELGMVSRAFDNAAIAR